MWDPCGPLGVATSVPLRRSRRTRTACSRSGLRLTAVAEHGLGLERRVRRSAPGARPAPAATNSENVTTAETGLPGSPNTSDRAAAAEPGRLAGLERDAPEHLLDAEVGERRLDVIVRADRYPAGDDHDVGVVERRGEPGLGRRAIVGQPAARTRRSRPRGRERVEHRRVRVVDLARARAARRERGARRRCTAPGPSGAGTRSARPRPAATAAPSSAAPRRGAGAEHGLARAHVLAGAAEMVAGA